MNKRLGILVFICLLLISSAAFSQDISGKWVGKLSQGPNGGYSSLYDLELDLKQKNKTIKGESYSYVVNALDWRVGLSGSIIGNTVQIKEHRLLIREEKMPALNEKTPDSLWQSCIKTMVITYRREGNREYLQGDWTGEGTDDSEPCEPGSIILSRTKEDIQLFLTNGGFNNPIPAGTPPTDLPLPVFTPDFKMTAVNKITEIKVNNPMLQIRLYDYLKIDNDTVSVYLNRNTMAKNVRISKLPVTIDFNLDTRIDINEILLFAENLGNIPPNTSLLEIIDGKHTYRMKIESDKQKTAAIYLKYKPLKPK